ncbi:DeoR/GlpR family DNA-binding transcription regulator [Mangrovicoccus algicola]|uniref:DeoR/GlpR transcriptional regulator n=1 Tax=Mangrovicoccus algicola TaxID=2771008 RepID=A0A8J6YVE5_9RHOB|nr:DeoR/GlpR family DNA-binding transcription regulator [Mangrovicoccus algicola]MBE3638347.1 DeoR/GlpR transcriptional regulator [Mangrovicoccus algicola]
MSQSFRHPQILEIARREGKVTVEDLVERLGVTPQTIRRDLNDLAGTGQLERVHGGAVLPSGTANIVYDERSRLNRAAKEAIGRACAAEVPQDASVFLNIGTTTEAVARHLLSHRGLMVMTNNLNVANILIGNPGAEIVVAGGSFRRSDGGLVGPLTQAAVESYKFDLAVIGCSAIDAEGDLLDFDAQEVGVTRTILRRARRVFLVADRSKFDRTAPVRIASLAEVDRLFTDRPLPPALAGLDLPVTITG